MNIGDMRRRFLAGAIVLGLWIPWTGDSSSRTQAEEIKVTRESHCFLPSDSAIGRFLYVFGPKGNRRLGAQNSVYVAFFRFRADLQEDITISVFDPDSSGAHDPFYFGSIGVSGQTTTEFSVYGGAQTVTDAGTHTAFPTSDQKGTVLASKKFTKECDNQWYHFGPFKAHQGEVVNNWSYFKVVAHALGGDDTNDFRLAASPRKGCEAFSYIYPLHLRIPERDTVEFFVEVPRGMTKITETNYDIDASGGTPYLVTPKRTIKLERSASGRYVRNEITLDPEETGVRCIYRFVKGPQNLTNMAFTMVDENDQPIRLFTSDGSVEAAPPTIQVAAAIVEEVKIPEGADRCMTFVFDAAKSFDPDNENLKYEWDFGDGTAVSHQIRTVHVFEKPGTYMVKLTVNDGTEGECAVNKTTQEVVANKRPVPAAETPNALVTGQEGNFDASQSTDTPGDKLSFIWDFGDGKNAEGAKATHAYTKGGAYTTRMTVKDDKNTRCSEASIERLVRVNTPPVANAGQDIFVNKMTPNEPLEVTVDGSKSYDPDGNKLSYAWDLGDGTQATGATVTHVYAKGGLYTAKLTVKDDSGLPGDTNTDEVQISLNRAPEAVAVIPKLGCVNEEIILDGTQSMDRDGQPITYAWDFGDGTQGEGAAPKHLYKKPGAYMVKLTVDDGRATNVSQRTVSQEIQIIGTVGATIKPIEPNTIGQPVTFEAEADKSLEPRKLKYSWEFGDGEMAEGIKANHTFQKGGAYKVKLTVQDDSGMACGRAVAEIALRINTPPTVVLDVKDKICCIDQPVRFDASASKDPDGEGLKYHWDFGDGETSEEVSPVHIFRKPGVFKVTLTVTDTSGLPGAAASATAIAKVNRAPVAVISVENE